MWKECVNFQVTLATCNIINGMVSNNGSDTSWQL